jgi:hypothetical protein
MDGSPIKCLSSEVVSFLEHCPTEYIWYRPSKDYSNYCFNIVADPKSIVEWVTKIDWDFVKKSLENGKKDKKWQDKHTGFGFTYRHCNGHDNAVNKAGVAEPRLRDDTFLLRSRSHFTLSN